MAKNGLWGVMIAALTLSVALLGFEHLATARAEDQDTGKKVPSIPSGGKGGAWGEFHDESLEVKGRKRSYRLFAPKPAEENRPMPLVFAFHGFRVDDKDKMALYTRLEKLARKEGFLLVFPNGLENRWRLRIEENEDLDFFDSLYRWIVERYNVDLNRVYATGMSNGAYFVNLLASQRSEKIAAIAPHSGGMGVLALKGIHAKKKYAVLIIHGSEDPLIPLTQAEKSRDAYRTEGHEVLYLEIPDLGHLWASVAQINDKIWEFFVSHPME